MASNWLFIDTNFPTFTGEESVTDKVTTIQNYMYMLVEQLRYTLHNLDLKNMNPAAVNEFTGNITEPIYGRIEDAEGNITALSITAKGLAVRITDAEGNISELGMTAAGLGVRLTNAEGSITSLTITAQGLQSQVTNQGGQISSLTQTVSGFTLSASNGSDFSYLTLSSGGINFGSAYITFSGMVTFTDLSTPGATTINGGNIRTGTISAISISACTITGGTVTGATLRSVSSADNGFELYYAAPQPYLRVGGIRYDTTGAGSVDEARDRMFIYTDNGWAMKLSSAGSMSLESNGLIFLRAYSYITLSAYGALYLSASQIYINGTPLDSYIRGLVG